MRALQEEWALTVGAVYSGATEALRHRQRPCRDGHARRADRPTSDGDLRSAHEIAVLRFSARDGCVDCCSSASTFRVGPRLVEPGRPVARRDLRRRHARPVDPGVRWPRLADGAWKRVAAVFDCDERVDADVLASALARSATRPLFASTVAAARDMAKRNRGRRRRLARAPVSAGTVAPAAIEAAGAGTLAADGHLVLDRRLGRPRSRRRRARRRFRGARRRARGRRRRRDRARSRARGRRVAAGRLRRLDRRCARRRRRAHSARR